MNPFPSHPRASCQALLATVFTSLVLAGCAAVDADGVNLISVEEEWEMGQEFEAELAEELDVSRDPGLTEMGESIVAQTRKSDLPWRFYVVQDETVNAFNVPGGLVYVHSGLIDQAGDEHQIAAVVAHEIGHGVARHGTERLTRQYGLSVLAGVVLGEDPGLVQQIVAEVVAAGTIARFSQAQEFEADELGVRYLAEAGYDPEGMIRLLESLMELQERDPGTVEQFFATHPSTEERISRVRELIDAL